jgi:CBS domain-containing protein
MTQSLVRDSMTPDVVSVDADASLDHVLRLLGQNAISCVLVTSGDEPQGVISMTDLVRVSKHHADADGKRPFKLMPPALKAKDVMKRDLISVNGDNTIGTAAKALLDHKIQRVFVKEGGKVVGVFSTKDAMRAVLARKIETPLREVMTSPVATVGIGETIDEALTKLDEENVRGLAVTDGRVPVGLFTQLEAIKARALPKPLRERPVEELMSYETAFLDASTPLYRAAGHGIGTELRRILVTQERALVGIVTGYDVARALID